MHIDIHNKHIETNDQGFLSNLEDWNEDYANEMAHRDGITLYNDHWELILYFREYFNQNHVNPTMHQIVCTLGKAKGRRFHEQKAYEKHIYQLFPKDPAHEVCKLAGLPMPQPDT